ncbi:hypothetical protein NE237_032967 [Protea cynaroides]|uniref:VQ domain-containing protein n=1 Tax=Protea cynaroides TaxID=273540 RepID=A0A9Q0L4J5_9MAGN|nr:hypothetical protein NE237_032967 [Protea cynaroides]
MTDIMAGPSDWLRFYGRSFTAEESPPPPPTSSSIFSRISDAPVVTSVITPARTGISTGSSSTSSTVQLNPEGRVAKPNRRRSRASRRSPTTLLNTDTTNFRAMVEQFTGLGSTPFATGPQPGAAPSNFNFETGGATIMAPGYHLQQQQPQQQQQQQTQQQFQRQQLQYMFPMKNTASDVFRQRFNDGNQ